MNVNLRNWAAVVCLSAAGLAAHAAINYTDRSGTVTTGGVSQTLAPANAGRTVLVITNGTAETEPLCVNVNADASCSAAGSFQIAPGGSLTLDTPQVVTITAATTGHKYTAKEVGQNFALVNGSTGSGGGGGDASAANQVTGNNSLASIDSKTPSLVSGRQPVDGSGVTQPISAASLPLPTGAATAAKQPALGTAGTPSADVISVQGVASGTALATAGGTAHDAPATSVAPTLTGGYASAAAPSDVTADGDAVRDWNLRSGAKVVQPSYAGTLAATGAGVVTAGTPRTTQASDSPLVTAAGAPADAACGSDTGTCSEIALKKRIAQNLTTLNSSVTADPNYSGPVAAGTAGTKSLLTGGVYNSGGVTLTNGQQAATQLSAAGRTLVDGSGVTQPVSAASLPLPSGAATAAKQSGAAGTGSQSSVSGTATDTTCLAANSNRLGASVFNDSSATLYLLLASGTSSSTAHSVQLVAGAYFEVPFWYTGVIKCIWASATGAARVAEFSQ